MRIYTDHNGLAVNAISQLEDGTDVEGHLYTVLAGPSTMFLDFQRGPVKENGVNGLTNEAMISILIHRLGLLNDKMPCVENEDALAHLELALHALESRTQSRIARGVEGREVA